MADDHLHWVHLGGIRHTRFLGLHQQPGVGTPGSAAIMDNCYPGHTAASGLGGGGGEGIFPAFTTVALPSGPDALVGVAGIHLDGPVSANVVTTDLWMGGSLSADLTTVRYYRLPGDATPTNFQAAWQTYLSHTTPGDTLTCPRIEFCSYRPSTANSAQPVHIAANNYRRNNGYIHLFPDPASPGTDSAALVRSSQVEAMIPFDQRLLWMESRTAVHTARGTARDANTIMFTDKGATTVGANNYFILSGNDPSWIAFMAPTDVADVFVCKFSSAFLLQGSAAAPREVKLPHVPGSVQQVPCLSPWGLAYGLAKGGVVLWQGGAGVKEIATEMNPDFWSSPFTGGAQFGGFEWSGPFLFAPNGFVWDSRTQAWWHHTDLAAARLFRVVRTEGRLVSVGLAANTFRQSVVDETGTRVSTWHWKSHPIPGAWSLYPFAPTQPPRYRPFKVREVQLIVQSWNLTDSCTYTVTVGGLTRTATVPASSQPQLVRLQFSVMVDALVVDVVATSAGQAGIMRELRVGYYEGTQRAAYLA